MSEQSAWERFRSKVGFTAIEIGCRLVRREGKFPIQKPINPVDVEVLADPGFQASVKEVASLTLLDTARLANLWALCRLTPKGNILEIGSYKGGGALHLSNACPDRKVIACDSFAGFETLKPELDRNFESHMFKDNAREKVEQLFQSRSRKYEVLQGFFPASCAGHQIAPVSFVHLDADVYKATSESLFYLAEQRILTDKALIVMDDFNRGAGGVNQAAAEFVTKHPDWAVFPLFPAQGLLVQRSWFV
jgi:predicted O-methyltransferase YrrM